MTNQLLWIALSACFIEAFRLPKSDPGPLLTAGMGVVLLARALVAKPLAAVRAASICVVVGVMIAGDEGLVNINQPLWFWVVVVSFVGYFFWDRIVERWSA